MVTKKTVEVVQEGDEVMVTNVDDKRIGTGVLVAQKIKLLRDKVKEISPSKMEAGRQKYNYLSEREMTITLRPVMQELGLVDVCVKTETNTYCWELASEDSKNGKSTKAVLLTEVEKTYRVYDVDSGDYVDFCCVGSGSDTMDKGCNKAVTGARKNFLKDLGNFPSPEREDPDTTPSNGYSNNKSNDVGSIELKFGKHAGKTLQDLFDENPDEVVELTKAKDKNGNPSWIAQKAQTFLDSLK